MPRRGVAGVHLMMVMVVRYHIDELSTYAASNDEEGEGKVRFREEGI